MTWEVNAVTDTGREQLAVVVNALETAGPAARLRALAAGPRPDDHGPGAAQDLLAAGATT